MTTTPAPQFRILTPTPGMQVSVFMKDWVRTMNEDLEAVNEWLRSVPKENE